MKNTLLIFLSVFFYSIVSLAWTLPNGTLDKKDWDSESLKGKTFVVFYVNPSKKNLNNKASEALKKENFSADTFSSVAVIDLKSTWIPNYLILKAIRKKQKKYPRTIYLKDKTEALHKELGFTPKGNDVFVFNAKGKEIFRHLGRLTPAKVTELIKTIKDQL